MTLIFPHLDIRDRVDKSSASYVTGNNLEKLEEKEENIQLSVSEASGSGRVLLLETMSTKVTNALEINDLQPFRDCVTSEFEVMINCH